MFIIENLPNEEWRSIIGYEGLYEISNYGRIKSIKFKQHRILNPNGKVTKTSRYLKVKLLDGDGGSEGFRNHRLCALYFVPNPMNLPEVNHRDGDRNNCHHSNLEWTTHHENILHGELATRNGKSSKHKGVSAVNGKTGTTWRWAVCLQGKHHRKWGFKTEEEAFDSLKQFYIDNKLSVKYLK